MQLTLKLNLSIQKYFIKGVEHVKNIYGTVTTNALNEKQCVLDMSLSCSTK